MYRVRGSNGCGGKRLGKVRLSVFERMLTFEASAGISEDAIGRYGRANRREKDPFVCQNFVVVVIVVEGREGAAVIKQLNKENEAGKLV
jgi:hypothetical protein